MPARPKPVTTAAGLTVAERILLFCLASDTDWAKAGVTHATAQRSVCEIAGLASRPSVGAGRTSRARAARDSWREPRACRVLTDTGRVQNYVWRFDIAYAGPFFWSPQLAASSFRLDRRLWCRSAQEAQRH